jgi:hypothetical protein
VLEADPAQVFGEPAGAAAQVGSMPGLRADRRKADELRELAHEARKLRTREG